MTIDRTNGCVLHGSIYVAGRLLNENKDKLIGFIQTVMHFKPIFKYQANLSAACLSGEKKKQKKIDLDLSVFPRKRFFYRKAALVYNTKSLQRDRPANSFDKVDLCRF